MIINSFYLRAQTYYLTPKALTFSVSSDAIGIHSNGAWYTGSLMDQRLNLIDSFPNKNGFVDSFYVIGEQEITTSGFNYYGGGFEYVPTRTFSSLLSHTNIPPDSLRLYLKGSVGGIIPTTGTSYLTGIAGAGLSYSLSPSGSIVWNTVNVGWQNPGTWYITSGLSLFFGNSTINTQSPKAAMLRKATLMKLYGR